ncbi:hypothetical protein [Oceanispirochaeta sp.]|jgi:type I restriction enzyme R subunit|uniref:hypothetical protein n=1 Tax=Oceanispirochaeta sp. TaxID=2035350 RepID=UPI0026117258|nr:hypothetical protein [Oceanispirochaeta sp.]MDA3956906.1 hypothetical protein [Oceanispirochaeta sp.]
MKTEVQTRKEIIGKKLFESAWDVNNPTQVVNVFDILVELPEAVSEARTICEGHPFSDCVLLGKDGKALTQGLINTEIAGWNCKEILQHIVRPAA